MNHTQRIAYVARQRRKLTKSIVKEAVELYLEALADEIASGEWVDIKGIGKIQVMQEESEGFLLSFSNNSERILTPVTQRLRTKMRLYKQFKSHCKKP